MSPPAGRFLEAWPAPPTPQAGLAALGEPLAEPDTVGFVHVARAADTDRRYLTRTAEPQQATALVCLPADTGSLQAIYCVSTADRAAAVDEFVAAEPTDESPVIDGSPPIDRSVAVRDPQTPPGTHVVSVLADRLGSDAGAGTLCVPSHLPHDAAIRFQTAGYELSSTAALTAARATKTDAEVDCLRAVQRAAIHGMRRAHELLAEATIDDGTVRVDGNPLSAQQLEREIAAALAAVGVTPETVRVRDGDIDATESLPAHKPITVQLGPRGPHGYHGHLTRTIVVDSDGGWDRRAFIAAKASQQAGLHHCEPEGNVTTVAAEASAELTAYGFPPLAESTDGDIFEDASNEAPDEAGGTATAHGVGLAPFEAPSPVDDGKITDGSVLAIETRVVDPEHGQIRLGELVAVTADGGERLIEAPVSLTPTVDDA